MKKRLSPGIADPTAATAARHAALGDEARGLLSDDLDPDGYFEALTSRALWIDAVRFLASALPKREAVWWAYLCARQAHGDSPAEAIAAALDAVRRWVVEPDEATRRGAEAAAEQAGAGTPAGCAALAAFWADGSLGPASLATPIPAADHLTARGVAGSVMLAAVLTEPEKAADTFRRFLALGSDVAAGTNRWTPGPTPPTTIAPARPPGPPSLEPDRPQSSRRGRRQDTWE